MGRAEPELPLLPWALRTLLLPMPRHLSMPLSRPPSMPQHRCHGRPSQHTLAVAMAEPKRELGAATAVSTALNYQAAVAYPLRLPLPRLRPARLGWAGACQSSRPWGGRPRRRHRRPLILKSRQGPASAIRRKTGGFMRSQDSCE
jgi:hypothetical protein